MPATAYASMTACSTNQNSAYSSAGANMKKDSRRRRARTPSASSPGSAAGFSSSSLPISAPRDTPKYAASFSA